MQRECQVNNAQLDCKLWRDPSFLRCRSTRRTEVILGNKKYLDSPPLSMNVSSFEKTIPHPHSFIPQPGLHRVFLDVVHLVRLQKDVPFDRVGDCHPRRYGAKKVTPAPEAARQNDVHACRGAGRNFPPEFFPSRNFRHGQPELFFPKTSVLGFSFFRVREKGEAALSFRWRQ